MSHFGSGHYSSNHYTSSHYGDVFNEEAFARYLGLTISDLRHEALLLVESGCDVHDNLRRHWQRVFGGQGTSNDILYEGAILGLGFPTPKEYYDSITGKDTPDISISEREYWLKIIGDNI